MSQRMIRVKYDPERYANGGFAVVWHNHGEPGDRSIKWTGADVNEAVAQGAYWAWYYECPMHINADATDMFNHFVPVAERRQRALGKEAAS